MYLEVSNLLVGLCKASLNLYFLDALRFLRILYTAYKIFWITVHFSLLSFPLFEQQMFLELKYFGVSDTGPRPTGPRPTGLRPTGPRPTGPRPTGPRPARLRRTGPRPTGPTGRQAHSDMLICDMKRYYFRSILLDEIANCWCEFDVCYHSVSICALVNFYLIVSFFWGSSYTESRQGADLAILRSMGTCWLLRSISHKRGFVLILLLGQVLVSIVVEETLLWSYIKCWKAYAPTIRWGF